MKIAIIMPAYNEEATIRETIISFYQELPEAHIYVVDNHSGDSTKKIAEDTLSQLGCGGEVFSEERQGKGNAIRKAFSEIDADIYVMVDADMTYSARDIHKLLEPVLEDEADMVVGDRLSSGAYQSTNKRRFHNFGNNLVKGLINFLFRCKLRDIMSGYRVFNRKFIKYFPILNDGFELETEMTLHAVHKKFSIKEIPIEYGERPEASFSKLNTIRDGARIITMIFFIFKDYKPFTFFGFFSLLFFATGLLLGFPVVKEFIETRYVSHVPLAILATGMMIFSLVLFSVGLTLNTIIRIHRYDFELKLVNYEDKRKKERVLL